ncbi:MAG: hypothetical protein FWE48_01820 [Coriobacteriia bacterium]|nr:hypothetical protein [Coriobacteriia bacterium]MCL2871265.1 hypothetical protein [Coriobacteriia bacterium]
MNMELKSKDTFYISGYSVKTDEASQEKDVASLREKYEDQLRSIAQLASKASLSKTSLSQAPLYLVGWATEDDNYIWVLGAETQNQAPIAEDATVAEIPASLFAIGAVPKETPFMVAWGEFMGAGIPALGATIDIEHGVFVAPLNEEGVYEVWTPVITSST